MPFSKLPVFMAQTTPQKGVNPAEGLSIRFPSAVNSTAIFTSLLCREQASYLHAASRYKRTPVPTGLSSPKGMGREPRGFVSRR